MTDRRIGFWLGFFVLLFVCFAPTSSFSSQTYHIKKGDTLSGISKRYHVSVQVLKEANHLKNNALSLNQALIIPTKEKNKAEKSCRVSSSEKPQRTTYVVRKGDTFMKIAKVTGVSVSDLRAINRVSSNRLRPGQKISLTYPQPLKPVMDIPETINGLDHFNLDDLEEIENVPESSDSSLDQSDEEYAPRFLGKWDDSKERDLLVKISKGFLGAPYRFGGATLRGLDCSAFVKRVYSIFDITLPRTAREQAQLGQKISRDNLAVGDLVFFNTRRYHISHVGIYIGNDEFVHASSGRAREVRVDSLNQPYYNKRFIKAVRIKELEGKL
ncbi:MAG TPA: NlpC/P60 family protein [Smithella sp.]|nr:NlpC/P60 family protein [Smithella sp.]